MNKFDGCHTIFTSFTSLSWLPRPARLITKNLCRQIADRGLYRFIYQLRVSYQ